jgi:hypothetical protein
VPAFKVRGLGFYVGAVVCLALLAAVHPSRAQESPSGARITFTKTLKGSTPEYFALTIDASGQGTYDSHKLDDAPAPRPLQISAGTTAQIFSLAASLNHFRAIDLDSHRKVANMGLKTLSFEDGKESNRAQYNYTENRTARHLTDMFEKISSVEEQIGQLEYAMKYDHLSLPEDLLQIQEDLAANNYLEPSLMVPTLEKIVSNSRFMHLAQSRAQDILQKIQRNK